MVGCQWICLVRDIMPDMLIIINLYNNKERKKKAHVWAVMIDVDPNLQLTP